MGTSLKGLRVKCQLKVAQKARKNKYTYYLIGMLFVYVLFIYLYCQITYHLRLIQGKQSKVTASLEHSLDALKVES